MSLLTIWIWWVSLGQLFRLFTNHFKGFYWRSRRCYQGVRGRCCDRLPRLPYASALFVYQFDANFLSAGLISQVAEDLWEVKDKKVINLTKQDISIVDYKKALAKRSTSHFLCSLISHRLTIPSQVKPRLRRLDSFPRVLPRVLRKSCSYPTKLSVLRCVPTTSPSLFPRHTNSFCLLRTSRYIALCQLVLKGYLLFREGLFILSKIESICMLYPLKKIWCFSSYGEDS